MRLGTGQSPDQYPVQLFMCFIGTGADPPAAGLPGNRGRWPLAFIALFSGRKTPILHESIAQLAADRTGKTEMDINNPARVVFVHRQMPVADIHPPGEAVFVVDNQQFTMIPHIQIKTAGERRRHKDGQLHPALFQQMANLCQGVVLTKSIDQHPDVNAPFDSGNQFANKQTAGAVGFKNVTGKKNRFFRRADCIQHCRVGLFTVIKHLDGIAANQRPPGDRAGKLN